MSDDDEPSVDIVFKLEEVHEPKQKEKLVIPRREPSLVVPSRDIILYTADMYTCEKCVCFPYEEPYYPPKLKKLTPCQVTPLTLYELCGQVVDQLLFPEAFHWTVEQVAEWMEKVVGFPQYKGCILKNKINGRRLMFMENPSNMSKMNINYWEHQKVITKHVRELYNMEFLCFSRSIGLPPRKLIALLNLFKARTGHAAGIRRNWTRSDILRWMKILDPSPVYLDHWDLVWYLKPDFPKTMFARIPRPESQVHIPHYVPFEETCNEYLAPRKFRLDQCIPEGEQQIWMEHRTISIPKIEPPPPPKRNWTIPMKTRLEPPKVSLKGKRGRALILARRLRPKPNFFLI